MTDMTDAPRNDPHDAILAQTQRLAAFSEAEAGGNPAGVAILEAMPAPEISQAVAAAVGYSETAFLHPAPDAGPNAWRIRYFAPEMEVPFCGHATIAAGAALGARFGPARYRLILNEGEAEVEALEGAAAALTSPPTRSAPAEPELIQAACALFGLSESDLDPRFAPSRAHGGADHLILALASREALARMAYDFEEGQALMRAHGLVTIDLIHAERADLIHARNPFASGGVYEDPATGAAAAALGGALRDANWPFGRPSGDAPAQRFEILQGVDMGAPSRLEVAVGPEPGAGVRVAGRTRQIA